MKTRILLVAISVVLACFASNVSADLINIDIDGQSDNGLIAPGTMTDVAGTGSAGGLWNAYVHYTPGVPSIASDPDVSDYLVDSNGSTKTVRFDLSSCVADSCGTPIRTGNGLLDDYVYTTPNNTITFTLQGLTAGNAYDLYLYGVAGIQSSSTYPTTFTVGGTDMTLNNANAFDGSFVEGREYVLFSDVVADGSGSISGVVSSPTNFYSIFNGVQIVGDFAAVEPPLTQNLAFDVPQIEAVTIDGNLSDWSASTAWSEDFIFWNDNGAPLTSTTKAKFAWNDAGDMLYVAIQTDQANGGHAVVGVGITDNDVPTTGVGSTQLAFDVQPDGTVSIMNEIDYYNTEYSLGWGGGGTDGVVAAQTNDGTTWTYELAIPYWKDWTTMSERQTISANDEYYVYLVMEDQLEGANGTDMTYEGNPAFYNGGDAWDVASKLTFKSSQIPGDANGDGKVDGSDVTILAGNWQKGVSDGQTATWAEGDFNGDGKVDGSDVTILAGNWQAGVTTAATAVPEPSTLVILTILAISTLFVWRRK